jgi:hypothetical protein
MREMITGPDYTTWKNGANTVLCTERGNLLMDLRVSPNESACRTGARGRDRREGNKVDTERRDE